MTEVLKRAEKLESEFMTSLAKQDETGVYDRVEITVDDFMFFINTIKETDAAVESKRFVIEKQEQQIADFNETLSAIRNILTKQVNWEPSYQTILDLIDDMNRK